MITIPREWEEITPGWMTEAIAGHYPGAEVDGVEVALRDDGTNRRARLALSYSAGDGPPTVFGKAVDPAHAELVALTSGLFHEPRLFSSGVVLPLDHPDVYCAAFDEAESNFVMIMEDVAARGADPRDSTRPLTVEQAAAGVRGLARLTVGTGANACSTTRRWGGWSHSFRSPVWNWHRWRSHSSALLTQCRRRSRH